MVQRDFPEVVLVRNSDNRGFSRANNQAARRARGQYFFFLNNDTVVPAGTLGRMLRYAEAHPEAGIVGPRLRDPRGRAQVSYRQLPSVGALLHRTFLLRWTGLLRDAYHRYRRRDFDPNVTRPVDVLMGAAIVLRREVFFACGGWDEDYTFGGEDIDLSARVGRHHLIVYHPEVEITHYGRVSTRANITYSSPNVAIGFARYLRKSGASPGALFFYKLVVTVDTPLHLSAKLVQYALRRLRRRPEKAQRSMLAARGLWHFLVRGMRQFWQA
jgi:hypothetical protein